MHIAQRETRARSRPGCRSASAPSGNPRHALPRVVEGQACPVVMRLQQRHRIGPVANLRPHRLGHGIGGDVVMRRADAAAGEHMVVATPTSARTAATISSCIIRHHPHFAQGDADPRQFSAPDNACSISRVRPDRISSPITSIAAVGLVICGLPVLQSGYSPAPGRFKPPLWPISRGVAYVGAERRSPWTNIAPGSRRTASASMKMRILPACALQAGLRPRFWMPSHPWCVPGTTTAVDRRFHHRRDRAPRRHLGHHRLQGLSPRLLHFGEPCGLPRHSRAQGADRWRHPEHRCDGDRRRLVRRHQPDVCGGRRSPARPNA